jgi:hypothetical protein
MIFNFNVKIFIIIFIVNKKIFKVSVRTELREIRVGLYLMHVNDILVFFFFKNSKINTIIILFIFKL